MEPSGISAAVAIVLRDFVIESAETKSELEEAFRLRYQVYCLERNFEPGLDGIEMDEFDAAARHVLLRHKETRQVIGTVRLVPARTDFGTQWFPMQQAGDMPRLRQLPRNGTVEVSRFALSKAFRSSSGTLGCLLRLALIRGIVALSGELSLTHWCALMEPKLLRLLQTSAIYFQQISGVVEHHGIRQPSVAELGTMLDRVRREKPEVWDFITDHGTLWQEERVRAAA